MTTVSKARAEQRIIQTGVEYERDISRQEAVVGVGAAGYAGTYQAPTVAIGEAVHAQMVPAQSFAGHVGAPSVTYGGGTVVGGGTVGGGTFCGGPCSAVGGGTLLGGASSTLGRGSSVGVQGATTVVGGRLANYGTTTVGGPAGLTSCGGTSVGLGGYAY